MKKPGTIRIIGGSLKRSKLTILDKPGLRPTPDRVRETVFNWLAPRIPDARVVDCFAGTGAFGFEALSRGAQFVTFIETDPETAALIRSTAARFQVDDRCEVVTQSVERWLTHSSSQADLIFADPPFHQGLSQALCTWIRGRLGPDSALVLEAERQAVLDLSGFAVLKTLHAGLDSIYLLAQDVS